MVPEIKFCGVTRAEDARQASNLGAGYVGVIFAGGPRRRTVDEAERIFGSLSGSTKRVGVFAAQDAAEIVATARHLDLQILQLHEPASIDHMVRLREDFSGEIWVVQQIRGAEIPRSATDAARIADAIVLDAHVPGMLGGTGVPLPWEALADAARRIRRMTKLVLAGGLRPENVRTAIAAISPDVVDVSSGVESSSGMKDRERMRAFQEAVMGAGVR